MDYGNKGGYGANMPNSAFSPPYVPEPRPQQQHQQQQFTSQNQTLQFGFYDSSAVQTPLNPNQGSSNYSGGYGQVPSGFGTNTPASAFQPVGSGNNYYAQQQPQMFMPIVDDQNMNQQDSYGMNDDNTTPENEPPLLEELGINFSHIIAKTVAVLNPIREPSADILGDTDLAGPLLFCVAFGFCLLMAGKVSFGHIYLLAVIGCLSMYSLLNLMSQQGVALILTVSILGYCLLPMVPLSLIAVFFSLQSIFGHILVVTVTLWCSMAASKLFSRSLSMLGQQALIAYPCFLMYGLFALLAVF